MSLRTILTVTMVVLAALAIAAALALVTGAAFFHRSAVDLDDAVESVRLAEELEVDLLVHGQHRAAGGSGTDAMLESRLRRNVGKMYRFSGSSEETALIRDMETGIAAYLAASDRGRAAAARAPAPPDPAMVTALQAVDRVVDINVRQAREVQQSAAAWDRWARIVGTVAALAPPVGLAALLLWVRGLVLRPIIRVSEAMRRFGAGERTVRAREEGPSELVSVARTFNEMAAALERQREAQLAFLAGIGHDLVNPLSALRLNVAIVGPDRPLPPEADVRVLFQRLERQVEKLQRMISDLLDAARVETGQLSLELQVCELKELVTGVVEQHRQAAPAHPITVSLPPAPVPVCCDPLRIEQVLANLVGNAVKYSPKGEPIEVALAAHDGRAVITVTDQGLGIPSEDRPHIFEPFRRGSRVRGISGLGLGLAVARRIVEAHGGRIELDEARRTGAAFRVSLPTAAEPRA